MSEVSEEMLMAFADGELSGDDHARIAAYVARSPEGAQRLAIFAKTGKHLAGLFDQPMREPVPQRLIDTVMKAPLATAASLGNARIIQLESKRRARPAIAAQPSWMLAAACVSLLIAGTGVVSFLNQQPVSGGGDFAVLDAGAGKRVAGPQLASALDGTISGATLVSEIAGSAVAIKPVFTFATALRGYCRQYVIERGAASAFGGVACREGAGQWRVEEHLSFASKQDRADEIKPAGKKTPAKIEAAVDRLISGDVLSTDVEARLLKGGWGAP
ncbi:MAG: hypothetical protein ABL893_17785 [Hyphomicrobium sp.]